jgi:hypothetical protein
MIHHCGDVTGGKDVGMRERLQGVAYQDKAF